MNTHCNPRHWAAIALRVAFYSLLVHLSIPYIGGVYYSLSGDHGGEQRYLDRSVAHLKQMRAFCDDPDLQGVLALYHPTLSQGRRVERDVHAADRSSVRSDRQGSSAAIAPGVRA